MNQEFDIGLDDLFNSCMNKNWGEVLSVYQNKPLAYKAKLTKTEDTAFHIIVSLNYADITDVDEYLNCIWKLVHLLPGKQVVNMLCLKNNKGNTPLHLAAVGGSFLICGIIAFGHPELIKRRNLKGETPIYLAAQHGKIEAFLCLYHIASKSGWNEETAYLLVRRKDGDTILHSAIAGEYFELAYQIIGCYPRLVFSVNEEGFSPLHILASKPNAFPSSSNLRVLSRMIYRFIFVERLEEKTYTPLENYFDKRFRSVWSSPDNYQTRMNFFQTCMKFFQMLFTIAFSCLGQQNRCPLSLISDEENMTKERDEELEVEDRPPPPLIMAEHKKLLPRGTFPPIYATCIQFYKVVINLLFKLGNVLLLQSGSIKEIWEMKKRHEWAVRSMIELIHGTLNYMYSHDGKMPSKIVESFREESIELPLMPPAEDGENISGCKPEDKEEKDENRPVSNGKGVESPILVAAKMGIIEMVERILEYFPVAIQDMDADGKNALLLTAENRQIKVFDFLMKKKLPEFLVRQVDNEGNSALHLAAMFEQNEPRSIPGFALLMQWELKWYEHVKDSIPPQYYIPYNNKGETAFKIFTRTHEKLVKDENEWLMKTSKSCSVVAALIASVAYATSSTVPGGFDQTAGYPLLENQHAFHIYSVTSVLALCYSVTALVFFLVILTSRSRQQDFRNDLPRKLLFGVISLLTSITAMLISFCAGHFFILKHQLPKQALSTYVIACLPLGWFAMGKLPFCFDVMWSLMTRVPYKVFHH